MNARLWTSLSVAALVAGGWAQAQSIDNNADFQSYQNAIISGIGDYSHLEGINEGTMRSEGALAATDTTSDAGQAYAIGSNTAAARTDVDLSTTNLSGAAAILDPEATLGVGFTEGSADGSCEPGDFEIPGEEGEFRYCEQRYQDVVVLEEALQVDETYRYRPGDCYYTIRHRITRNEADNPAAWFWYLENSSCTFISIPSNIRTREYRGNNSPSWSIRRMEERITPWIAAQECNRATSTSSFRSQTEQMRKGGYSGPDTVTLRVHWDCNIDETTYTETWLEVAGFDELDDTCVVPEPTCVDGPRSGLTTAGNFVFLSCWKREAIATCSAGGSLGASTCTELAAQPECGQVRSTCTVFDTSGTVCIEEEVQYYCTTPAADVGDLNTQCHSTEVCVSGLCETYADDGEDSGFLDAMTTLIVVDEAVEDTEGTTETDDINIFAGSLQSCRIQQLSALNCCKDSGWTNDLINDCSQAEISLGAAMDAGATSRVDTRCTSDTLFGCFEKERRYCNFQSLMARIIQEEGRRQLGQSIITNCRGFTGEEFSQLDLTQIDLSPIYGEAVSAAELFDAGTLTDTLFLRLDTE